MQEVLGMLKNLTLVAKPIKTKAQYKICFTNAVLVCFHFIDAWQ